MKNQAGIIKKNSSIFHLFL